MLIAHCIQALVALLGLATLFQQVKSEEHYNNETLIHKIVRRSPGENKHRHAVHSKKTHIFHGRNYPYHHDIGFNDFEPGKMLTMRDNKNLLEQEYGQLMENQGPGIDCCPTVFEMIEPEGGKNDQGIYVELFKSENYRQRFYELSCHKDVLNKPCRFMDKKLHAYSRCVQMHSYTYALVRDTPDHRNKNLPTFPGTGSGNNTYTLDYISVRSGCICVVKPPPNRRKKKMQKNKRKGSTLHRPVLTAAIERDER